MRRYGEIRMKNKLLIIGAGGHGQVVAEIAEDCGYQEIVFVDDNDSKAIGKIEELKELRAVYSDAFVGIGNNAFRESLLKKLKDLDYNVPVLIHPSAYISRTCTIENGVVIEPKAIVNAHSLIGEGSIISVGSIVDHNVKVGKYCHINSGAIVKAGAEIENYYKLEAGEVVLGYEAARVKR